MTKTLRGKHALSLGASLLLIVTALLSVSWAQGGVPAVTEENRWTLVDLLARAERSDAEYRAAVAAEAAGRENRTLGEAALRPSVQSNGNLARNRQDATTTQPVAGRVEQRRFYDSANLSVRLTQPLYSLDNLGRYQDGIARWKAAELTFGRDEQTFIARVIQRYVAVLAARRQLELLKASGVDLRQQERMAEARLDQGEGTRLELAEVRTALRRWQVDLIGAEAAIVSTTRALEVSVGPLGESAVDLITDSDEPPKLFVGQPDLWVEQGVAESPEVGLANTAVELAEAALTRARGQRRPRIDGYASFALNDSDSVNTVDQKYETGSVGLQFSMPLYLGGAGQANLRKAKFELEQARAERDATVASVALEITEAFDAANIARDRLVALETAEEAAELSFNAARESLRLGVEGLSEVLAAQRELRNVQSEKINERYQLIMSFVELNGVVGKLDSPMVQRLSDILSGQRDNGSLPDPDGRDVPRIGLVPRSGTTLANDAGGGLRRFQMAKNLGFGSLTP